jgi:Ca-activated chloride channel family protein
MCHQTLSPRRRFPFHLHLQLQPILNAIVCVAVGLPLAMSQNSQAAGLLVASGQFGGVLEIKEHTVNVTINNGVVVTQVDQIFVNREDRIVEALYTFPVPKGASIANFSMWINGKEMIGEVVEKQRAREIYNTYKQQNKPRDPGLLEQVDYKTFEMRIFPIAARAQQRVQVTYYQELDFDNDWATYVYPLATVTKPGVNQTTTGKFSLTLHARSEIPIKKLESPSHKEEFVVVTHSQTYKQASLELTGGDLSRDLVLAYQIARPKTGVDLITTKQADEDGYLQMTITAGEEVAKLNQPMDFVFVLDVSGSMASDGKLIVSRKQLAEFANALQPEDQFEVIAFNIKPFPLFNKLNPANQAAKTKASTFLENQKARGGTELSPALSAAYRYKKEGRLLNVILLSDGMTDSGARQTLSRIIKARPADTRVFCIGVGNDVNRPLLRQVAEDTGGLAAFLSRGDDFERQANAFRRKLTRPAATNLSIKFEGMEVYDVEPKKLPALYYGTPVRIYARYKSGGPVTIKIRGDINGTTVEQTKAITLPKQNAQNSELERMWAWHRINTLMRGESNATRSQRAIGEIVRLGEAYSITSQYTSFIVLENDAEYKRWQITQRNALRIARDRKQQQRVQKELASLRQTAQVNIGPGAPVKQVKTTTTTQETASNQAPARQNRSSEHSWNFGGGAMDPVTGLIIFALAMFVIIAARKQPAR